MNTQSRKARQGILLGVLVMIAAGLFWQQSQRDPQWLDPPKSGRPRTELELAGKIKVQFVEVAKGFQMPTDLQFVAGQDTWLVTEKGGDAWWLSGDGQTRGKFLHAEVATESEEGLLGLALHPGFAQNGRFFVNQVVRRVEGDKSTDWTQLVEWHIAGPVRTTTPTQARVILEVQQPYANHNAGQLQFGPDGMLYMGLGDGGAGGDPHGNGQNPGALLGKMLRLDVDHQDPGLAYAVPKDNPFVGKPGYRPEIWALGLRNPWRYSFDPRGQLVVADVGQDAWEELDIIAAGANLGWNRREAAHPFAARAPAEATATTVPAAPTDTLTDPIWSYGHDVGTCITGGYVALGNAAPGLRGKFVVADFIAGTFWALDLPATASATTQVWELAQTKLHVATFGRSAAGDLWAADVFTGTIWALRQ